MRECVKMRIILCFVFGEEHDLLQFGRFASISLLRHFPDDDNVSMCSESSMLLSSYDAKNSPRKQAEFNYPSQWTVEDVVKWLGDVSLHAFGDNFRRHEIDGSVLIDETDGVNDDVIRQLIPPIGAQLKFRRMLRALRR